MANRLVRKRDYQGVPDGIGEHYWHDVGVKGFWSVIKPYGRSVTNAATNPSAELFETSWFGINTATRERSRDAAIHGDVGLLVITTAANQGVGYEMFPQFSFNTTYWACISIDGAAGTVATFTFEYGTPGLSFAVPAIVTLPGYPVRVCAKFGPVPPAYGPILPTLPISVRFDRAGEYYVDGLVLTTTDEPITFYFDGDSPGASWQGLPHASASTIDGFSRVFGEQVNFNEIGFNITGSTGFGLTTKQPITTSFARLNGAHLQRVKDNPRIITLSGTFESGGDPARLHESRNAVLDALRWRFKNQCTQEMILCYSLVNDCGDQISPEVQIPVVYQGGLEGNWGALDRERATIVFAANSEQSFSDSFDSSGELFPNGTVVIDYEGTDDAWPDVHIYPGAGGLNLTSLHNDTTGHSIYFGSVAAGNPTSLNLIFGQYAILRTDPAKRITLDLYDYTGGSSPVVTRIMHYIRYEVSQVGLFRLVPGENQFRAPASLSTGGARIFLRWRNKYESTDHLCVRFA